MPTFPPTTNADAAMTLGERMTTAARLLAAEHVRQEVEAIRAAQSKAAGVFASVPIVADDDAPVRVAVRRRERPGVVAVRRDTAHLIEPAKALTSGFRPWRRAA